MELAWIVIVTLKLTRANILRIKETLVHLIAENPLPSAFVFVAIAAIVMAFILKNKNSA